MSLNPFEKFWTPSVTVKRRLLRCYRRKASLIFGNSLNVSGIYQMFRDVLDPERSSDWCSGRRKREGVKRGLRDQRTRNLGRPTKVEG